MSNRQFEARDRRITAAEASAARPAAEHRNNGDEHRLRDGKGRPTFAGSFTKCMPHDENGFLRDPTDYSDWVRAIDTGDARDFRSIRLGPGPFMPDGSSKYVETGDPENPYEPEFDWHHTYTDGNPGVRAWESQGAGLTFDLEGADSQTFTMPPHPSADSQELISEMAEVYWMALCRDVPFADWEGHPTVTDARASLARFWWFRDDRTHLLDGTTDRHATSLARRRILNTDDDELVDLDKLFRGVTPGEQVGPYVSQFLLIGNRGVNGADTEHALTDGYVAYGAMRMDQRVRSAPTGADYMTNWDEFLDVQNGANVGGGEPFDPGHRFVSKPRDLATYVHYDALYQAYLNACLILFGLKAPVDPGLPFLRPDHVDKQQGFAQFGNPHLLTLVTEVATRALKAVRFQKFNVHRRMRPEALAGWMYQRRNGDASVTNRLAVFETMENAFAGSPRVDVALDAANGADNWLLPMAFPEGSPAHPSYGAGHATVAGACVTILKAWFDHGWELDDGTSPIAYAPNADGTALVAAPPPDAPLTVEGELNKLAGNISVGRNWAGVHYYSDYIESFRLGEQIALSLLEEQKLTYSEAFSLTVPLHDGTTVRI
ncbi:MAG: vanadium-dependent haloperoxidase [Ilumatobacter sp.]|uniref:vanadium-dependent haloperoxidase n=1 Tax=Ilumatobacter sp. TaxID=1967498 RepID=UPI003C78FA49